MLVPEPIYDMDASKLQELIKAKEKEYQDAMKAKKVFWEVKKIIEQKRAMEMELLIKQCKVVR